MIALWAAPLTRIRSYGTPTSAMENLPSLSTSTGEWPSTTAVRPITGKPVRFIARPWTVIVSVGSGFGGSSGGPPQAASGRGTMATARHFETDILQSPGGESRAAEQGACQEKAP